jgi:hypothetical protein
MTLNRPADEYWEECLFIYVLYQSLAGNIIKRTTGLSPKGSAVINIRAYESDMQILFQNATIPEEPRLVLSYIRQPIE